MIMRQTNHRTHIRANQQWWKIDWKAIVEYRDLLWLMALRDLTAIYKQSILGPVWFIIQPLAMTLVFTVIFGKVAKISTDGVPPFMFYMSGMVLWNYFQGCMNSVGNSLIANAGILGKVYFPRLVIPLSLVTSNLAQLILNVTLFIGFYVYFLLMNSTSIKPTWILFFFPLIVLQTAAVGLGVGLWLAALTAKYRDLRFALPFLGQVWMYATPIVYPASEVTSRLRWILALNPMSYLIELNRHAFLGVGVIDMSFIVPGAVSGLFLLATGLLFFNRVQRTFVDTI
jgi:lipopolysaccharide transport system permease protein